MRKMALPSGVPARVSTEIGKVLGHWCQALGRLAVPVTRLSRIWPLRSEEGGAVVLILGIMATVIVGIVGLGIDVIGWYRTDRAMQNAADSAAIAAARNGTSSYQSEAKAVAAQYGFVDGTGGVTVTALNNQTCPNGQTDCYLVTVANSAAPQFFSQVLGFPAPGLSSAATAGGGQTHNYCLLALASSGTDPAITTNGAPKADLAGCSIMSDTGSNCHGHNLNADNGDAHKTNSGCGVNENSNVPFVADPYSYLASDIPAWSCPSGYPQEFAKKKDPPLPATNVWSNTPAAGVTVPPSPLPATTIICGDLQLSGNGTIQLNTASPGSVLVIVNGRLDTGSATLKTAAGSALTIIFSGTSGSYTHAPTGGGTLDIQAPTTGTWKGVAIYQDPALTTGVDVSAAGNSPTWDITGLVYLPHASVTFSGAVNKSSNGASCFVLVVDNITINGTADILPKGACVAAGLSMPTDTVGTIGLVR
jgi:Flp pilus assembly protein TadG